MCICYGDMPGVNVTIYNAYGMNNKPNESKRDNNPGCDFCAFEEFYNANYGCCEIEGQGKFK